MKTITFLPAIALLACYNPSARDCTVICGSGNACPEGAVCSNGRCTTGPTCAMPLTIGYVIQGDTLFRIDDSYQRLPLSNDWSGATSMAYRRWNGNDWVHAITSDRLWKASGLDGSGFDIPTDRSWTGATNMTWNASTGKLYIINGGWLYRMEDADNDGTYAVLGDRSWFSTTSMTSLGRWLYVVRGSGFYKVDPETGEYTEIGTFGDWSGARMVTQIWNVGDPAHLYVLHDDDLYEVDPDSGAEQLFGSVDAWPQWTAIFCNGNSSPASLYIIEDLNDRLLRVDAAGGWHETDGLAAYDGPAVSAGADCYH